MEYIRVKVVGEDNIPQSQILTKNEFVSWDHCNNIWNRIMMDKVKSISFTKVKKSPLLNKNK